MYKIPKYTETDFIRSEKVEGELLETKIERIVHNNEPIKDGAPLLFTERKDGVRASTNIRTDRWEIAIDGMDKVQKSYQARRENKGDVIDINRKKDGGAESIQDTSETSNS